MKLRLLAARLGSPDFEEWVKYEAEGYPSSKEIPKYRRLSMAFIGHFSGPFGSTISNAPIPPVLIRQIAGKQWEHYEVIHSASAIDSLMKGGNGVNLDLSNLALLIQGKVYEDMACNQLTGFVSHQSIVELANAIRNRVLELTIELEKSLPNSGNLELSKIEKHEEIATQVFHQTVNGSVTHIHNSGENQTISINVKKGSLENLREELRRAGLAKEHAIELGQLISAEKPRATGSLNRKAREWFAERITNGADEGIKGGIATVMQLAQEAAKQYWGL
jgi:hypothetical protein